ncbi:3'(2'),5'-bisphosphate nucleotidase CysQ [Neptuniibacter caesariensis]|uniref:3'(2'),5'-bisphosphate nucleotidase CysQ n=1 Tax=Neptuniibacter caesariensis TaxID=207954 RepID=A0A7U8C2X2_NEPCE|nr:3'(2'),5'-bisphosphate nucleotidase CysQ [Neptuniibacter caesariensis]EAR60512.1 3'-Phosphoadenosine 5'-phosphosulfate (PAPS) 3'-phosphatase [Oceanospirillum sp. MED92] [Neptuniibacter caesariensis]
MSIAKKIFKNSELFQQLEKLMNDADTSILEIYNSNNFGEESKGDDSPVTKADLAAHQLLVDGLQQLTPNIPIVSEEDPSSLTIPAEHSAYWLIDPLDGTKEFIKRNDEFTCNLALIESGASTLGFVSIPAKQELYYGGKELGSFKQHKQHEPTPIHHSSKKGATRVVASKSHLNAETQEFIAQLQGKIELIQAGSSLKFLKIATGEADLYPRLAPTCEWDTAAAHAILEGAGGKVLQADSLQPLVYAKENILNPYFIASAKG